jgi:hypothetical protein
MKKQFLTCVINEGIHVSIPQGNDSVVPGPLNELELGVDHAQVVRLVIDAGRNFAAGLTMECDDVREKLHKNNKGPTEVSPLCG